MSYSFSLIRFVPDPGRGEFVNIGAVAGDDDSGEWALRAISNYQRAKALDTKSAFPAALAFVASIEERLPDIERLGFAPEWSLAMLGELAEDMQNIVQVTPPAPIVADSAEGALDVVFDRLIIDPAKRTFRFQKKTRAQAATRRSYREHGGVPNEAIAERARVTTDVYGAPFDFAVHNAVALQLVQCWSFQLPDQAELAEQVRSWAWIVHELRERGATLHTAAGAFRIPKDLDIAAVGIAPAPGQDAPAYREAEAAFAEIDVRLIPPEEAHDLAMTAADLLGRDGGHAI